MLSSVCILCAIIFALSSTLATYPMRLNAVRTFFCLLTAEFQSATFWLHFEEHHSLIHSRSMFFPVQFGFFFSWYDWDLCQEKIIDLKNGQEVPKDRKILVARKSWSSRKKCSRNEKRILFEIWVPMRNWNTNFWQRSMWMSFQYVNNALWRRMFTNWFRF